jgi:hypothetical protein
MFISDTRLYAHSTHIITCKDFKKFCVNYAMGGNNIGEHGRVVFFDSVHSAVTTVWLFESLK